MAAHIPCISTLQRIAPHIRQHACKSIYLLASLQDDAVKPFDFNSLLKHDIEEHAATISTIALKASKEAGLERALDSMRKDWTGVAFTVVAYKDTGTYIIGGIDEVQALLDDQAVRVAAVCSSPFVAHVAAAAERWQEFVMTLQVPLSTHAVDGCSGMPAQPRRSMALQADQLRCVALTTRAS